MRRRLRALDGRAGDPPGFEAWRDGRPQGDGEALLVVHPGDMIEAWCRGSRDDLVERSLLHQAALAGTLARARSAGCPVGVLHRRSCSQFWDGTAGRAAHAGLGMALAAAQRSGAVAFGDDLEAAAAWLVTAMGSRPTTRVLVTGAYAHPRHGCVDLIAASLAGRLGSGGSVRVDPGAYAAP